jgi:hypothetical protein
MRKVGEILDSMELAGQFTEIFNRLTGILRGT